MRQYDSCCKKCNSCNTVVSANYAHTTTNNVHRMYIFVECIPQNIIIFWWLYSQILVYLHCKTNTKTIHISRIMSDVVAQKMHSGKAIAQQSTWVEAHRGVFHLLTASAPHLWLQAKDSRRGFRWLLWYAGACLSVPGRTGLCAIHLLRPAEKCWSDLSNPWSVLLPVTRRSGRAFGSVRFSQTAG